MTRGRRRALGFAIVIVALAALAFMQVRDRGAARERPTLLLLTSLPLMFGEDFSLQGGGSPALKALQARYRVVPISVTSSAELTKGRLLLMAQPQAQPPEDLVALDEWVRAGGRVLLLADPLLEWPSARPLGDRLRPPVMFADTGLLAHWGLRLDAPDEPGPVTILIGGRQVETTSPGRLFGSCRIGGDRIVAHCSVGQGRATVVADADFLDVERLGAAGSHNLDGLIGELDPLE
jgi:hypothetical protein